MKIASVFAQAWDVPMRAPYRSAQRVTTTAHNVLVTVTLSDGSVGYGESAPATYVTGETQESVLEAAQHCKHFVGHNAEETALFFQGRSKTLRSPWMGTFGTFQLEKALRDLATHPASKPGAAGAFEMALLDAWARSQGMPLFRVLRISPSPPSAGETDGFTRWRSAASVSAPAAAGETQIREETEAQTDLSLPILSPENAGERAAKAAQDGFRALKIKVGCGDAGEDARRVRAVAENAPQAKLRLDGNQGFTGEEAVRFFDGLPDLHARIELLEQPTKAGDDAAMKWVADRVPCPVFADESVHDAGDATRLLENGTCGGVVLKLAKMGIAGAMTVGKATKAAGGICLFGCMMETRVATTAALHTALALGADIVPMLDLDGHLLVRDDELVTGGLTQTGDILHVDPQLVGMGLTALVPPSVL